MFTIPVVKNVMINIPSVRDDEQGFHNLWKRLFENEWDISQDYFITLDFTSCNYAGINLTALIGAFACFVRRNLVNSTLRIETKTMNKQVHLKLRNMKLLESLDRLDGSGFTSSTDDIIPYKEFPVGTEEQEILAYLRDDWLGKNRLNFTEEVESAVLSSLWEVYANAFEHSSTLQVQSCGSYDRKAKTLSLLVGDSGKGIITNIKEYLKEDLSAKNALEWALVKGNSTYTANLKEEGETQPRGLGLHLLTELVDINDGCMDIYTDLVSYKRTNKISTYSKSPFFVQGTWIKLTLNCKQDVMYYFKDENIPEYF